MPPSDPTKRTGRAPWMDRRPRPIRVGHRGAGAFVPQNTLRSYKRAIESGVDMVETDLRRSADGALVLAHDNAIRDVDGRRLAVADHPLPELRALDLGFGETIATLDDVIETCRGRCALMIDLKGEGFESDLVETLSNAGFEDVVIPGGSLSSRRAIRALNPALPLSLSLDPEWRDRIDDAFIASIETDAVTWHYSLLDESTIERLHAAGLFVFAWTVDRKEEIDRLIACGVDGVISNRTDLLEEIAGDV